MHTVDRATHHDANCSGVGTASMIRFVTVGTLALLITLILCSTGCATTDSIAQAPPTASPPTSPTATTAVAIAAAAADLTGLDPVRFEAECAAAIADRLTTDDAVAIVNGDPISA